MAANPVGLVIIAVAALAAGIYLLSKAFDTSTTAEKLNAEVRSRALDATIDQRVEVTMLFMALRKAEVGSLKYNDTLKELERIQPGIIDKYNLQAGALQNINAAEKELIGNIMKRAETEVRAELMKEKIKAAMVAESEGPDFWDKAAEYTKRYGLASVTGGLSEVTSLQSYVIDSAEQKNTQNVAGLYEEANILAEQLANDESTLPETELVNPEKTKNDVINSTIENTTKEKVLIEFANAPEGMSVSGGANTSSNFSMPSMGSTK